MRATLVSIFTSRHYISVYIAIYVYIYMNEKKVYCDMNFSHIVRENGNTKKINSDIRLT